MKHGTFVFADLSTFDQSKAKDFYSDVFGWRFTGTGYATSTGGTALYPMPQKFIDIGMPSFWMSYIAVEDVDSAVDIARKLGGKVELGPETTGNGRFALIRDPLGAGFTVWEGGDLGPVGDRAGHGLFVENARAVMPFYQALFGWIFAEEKDGVRPIKADGKTIAYLHEIPDPGVRGKEQYWGVYFSAPVGTVQKILAKGGEIIGTTQLPEGDASIARDPDGGTFFVLENGEASLKETKGAPGKTPWKGWAGFGLIVAMVIFDAGWLWAVFLAAWLFSGIRDRETWLFQRVTRADHAALYYCLLGLYAVLLLLSLSEI